MLRNLTEEQYNDIMRVCEKFPHVEMSVNYEGKHDLYPCIFYFIFLLKIIFN